MELCVEVGVLDFTVTVVEPPKLVVLGHSVTAGRFHLVTFDKEMVEFFGQKS